MTVDWAIAFWMMVDCLMCSVVVWLPVDMNSVNSCPPAAERRMRFCPFSFSMSIQVNSIVSPDQYHCDQIYIRMVVDT